MRVHHAHQGRALAGEILEAQEGDAAVVLRPQGGFHFGLIAQKRAFPRGFHHPLPVLFQPLFPHLLLNMPQVIRDGDPLKLIQLAKVRQHFILPHLEGEHGLIGLLPDRGHRFIIIMPCVGIFAVQPACKPVAGGPHIAAQIHHGGIEIAGGVRAGFSVMDIRAVGVQAGGIIPLRRLQQPVHTGMAGRIGLQLVAEGEHYEGGVIRQAAQDLHQLRAVIVPGLGGSKGVLRIPMGELRLHQHAQFIRGRKGRFRRAMAVEPHAVDPVGLIFLQNVLPGIYVHGRMTRFREHGAVGFAAEENPAAVQREMPVLRAEIPQTEGYAAGLQIRAGNGQGVQAALPEIPF